MCNMYRKYTVGMTEDMIAEITCANAIYLDPFNLWSAFLHFVDLWTAFLHFPAYNQADRAPRILDFNSKLYIYFYLLLHSE